MTPELLDKSESHLMLRQRLAPYEFSKVHQFQAVTLNTCIGKVSVEKVILTPLID
jgi:hypothetical protein